MEARSHLHLLKARCRCVEEKHRYCGPDQCYQSFSNHGTIEHGASHFLRLQTTRHQGTLRSMETADGSAGNRNKQSREDAVSPARISLKAHISEVGPQLGQRRPLHEERHHQRSSHEQQRKGKERVDLADNLVDRQHRGDDIVTENNTYPHHRRTTDVVQYLGRRVDKHRSYHHQQQYREHKHDVSCGLA